MSEIRVDTFKAEDGISAPSFPNGIQVTGVVTATVLDSTVPFLSAGNNIHLGNAGIITATELKATNVSVAGTLTYEDVSNVDSIGVITARSGVDVDDFVSVGNNIHLGNAGVVTATAFHGSGASLTGIDATALKDPAGNVKIQAQASGAVYTGIHTFSTVNTTTVTGDGSGVSNINASNIASGTIAAARVPTLNQNTTGSAASLDVANASANSTYYVCFTDNNGSAKTLSIDSGGNLQYNPNDNTLIAGTLKGKGTVEVHTYSVDSAGDVGNGSNWVNFSMTPSIDWNRVLWNHAGAHRASNDSYYYAKYTFSKGGGDVDQHTRGFGRASSGTTHNQGWAASGFGMESNGSYMTGSAGTGCNFKCNSISGGNSGPAADQGHDHMAWVIFFHD